MFSFDSRDLSNYLRDCLYEENCQYRQEIDRLHRHIAAVESRHCSETTDLRKELARAEETFSFCGLMRTRPFLNVLELYWTLTRWVGLRPPREQIAPAHDDRDNDENLHAEEADGAAWPPRNSTLLPAQRAAQQMRPRILVDVTNTAYSPAHSGIQRVVREFAKVAIETGLALPVLVHNGRMVDAYGEDGVHAPVPINHHDCLLLLDPNWPNISDYVDVVVDLKSHGGQIIAFFYDTVPMTLPQVCDKQTVKVFAEWFSAFTTVADAIMCNTGAIAEEIAHYIDKDSKVPIGWVPPATNAFVAVPQPDSLSKEMFDAKDGVFLSVGTIEPRKGHPIALKAFEDVWRQGLDVHYLIVGRYGWSMSWFAASLREHPQFGKKLFWLDNADDGQLAFAYENAQALIMPSLYEGYGLPLIEACQYNIPIVLTDLDVFKEVMGGRPAHYFRSCDSHDLARCIHEVVESKRANAPPRPAHPVTSWRECVERTTTMIRERAYQRGGAAP